MTSTPKHLQHHEGGRALSAFRAQALLARLQAVNPRVTGVDARHVHWVWTDRPLAHDEADKVAALLRYGDPYEGTGDRGILTFDPMELRTDVARAAAGCRPTASAPRSRWR